MSGAADAAIFYLESVDPLDAMRSHGDKVYNIRRDAKAIGRAHYVLAAARTGCKPGG
jgi:hypothetical protein